MSIFKSLTHVMINCSRKHVERESEADGMLLEFSPLKLRVVSCPRYLRGFHYNTNEPDNENVSAIIFLQYLFACMHLLPYFGSTISQSSDKAGISFCSCRSFHLLQRGAVQKEAGFAIQTKVSTRKTPGIRSTRNNRNIDPSHVSMRA